MKGEGNEGEGEHGGRAGRPDVEAERAAFPDASGPKDDGAGPHLVSFQEPAAEGGAGAHGLQVLGPQAGLLAPGPDVSNADGLCPERGEGNGEPEHRAAAGVHGAVDLDHDFHPPGGTGNGPCARRVNNSQMQGPRSPEEGGVLGAYAD